MSDSAIRKGVERLAVSSLGGDLGPEITSATMALPVADRKKYLEDILGPLPQLDILFPQPKQKLQAKPEKEKELPGQSNSHKTKKMQKELPGQSSAPKQARCGCMGTRHACVGSCTLCGMIVCEEEAKCAFDVACLNCGKRNSCYPSLQAKDLSTSSLGGKQVTAGNISGYQKAYSNKDKLLQFDRENTKRTHVHDAQADYYESTAWLTDEERAKIDAKRQKARDTKLPSNRRYQMSLDIAGRRKIVTKTSLVEEEASEGEEGEAEDEEKGEGPPLSLNAGLEGSQEKAGCIYRILTESLAPWRGSKTAVEF